MDPRPVPPTLQKLTPVEEMHAHSPVTPLMSVYRLPRGQLGYGGHVINLEQNHVRIFGLSGFKCYMHGSDVVEEEQHLLPK